MSKKPSLADAFHSALSGRTLATPRTMPKVGRIVLAVLLATAVAAAVRFVLSTRGDADEDPQSFAVIQPADVDPDCNTEDECRASCAAHHTPACSKLVRQRVKFPDFEKAACDLGVGHACAQYGKHLEYADPVDENKHQEVARYEARAAELERLHCDGGDASSCWYLAFDELSRSRDCKACARAIARACSLGLVIACTSAGTTEKEKRVAWRSGIGIALGTCDRDRGLNMLCTRALAEMTAIPLAATANERDRSARARSVLAERLSAPLERRCPASIDACLGYALLEHRRSNVTGHDVAAGRVQHVIETLARGCDDRKPNYCLGLALLLGGRTGLLDEIGLEGTFGDYRDVERARHAGLRACALARSRDGDRGSPQECDFILNRMKADDVNEALRANDYTR